jgi:glycosidase
MINRAGVIHRTSDNMCYPIDKDIVYVSIKTGKEINNVKIIHGDPFAWGILGGDYKWTGVETEIVEKVELENHFLWKILLKPIDKRVKYFFELHAENECLYYYEDGFKNEMEANAQCFTFPWLNEVDIASVPRWAEDMIWYQIFPDRFAKSLEYENFAITNDWHDGKVTNEQIYGGNILGVIEKIDYLKNLGITGIYFTPLFEAHSIHKYDTTDYYQIDKMFGSNEDFKLMVELLHENGIKIMIDCVFNHCGPKFGPWLDVVQNREKSKYKDWFFVNDYNFDNILDTKNGEFYSFAYNVDMPKLNTNNIEVQNFFVDVCNYWIDDYGVDAIRIDVANECSHDFNKYLRKNISNKNDVYIIGEIWHDSIEWLKGDEFDSVMNYPIMSAINKFFNNSNASNKQLYFEMNRIFNMYKVQNTNVLFNLLDSHDTDRLSTRNDNIDVTMQQLALLFLLPGAPCIYYGTEVFLEGQHDPDCRRCMPWDKIDNVGIKFMKELIAVRKKYVANDELVALDTVSNRHLNFRNGRVEIFINCDDIEVVVDLSLKVVITNGDGILIKKNQFVIYEVCDVD